MGLTNFFSLLLLSEVTVPRWIYLTGFAFVSHPIPPQRENLHHYYTLISRKKLQKKVDIWG